jgi:hypothetical protein
MAGFPPSVQLIGIGWFVALTIVLGVVGGVLLDNAFGTDPIITMVGLMLGLVLALWGGYTQLMDTLRMMDRRREKK